MNKMAKFILIFILIIFCIAIIGFAIKKIIWLDNFFIEQPPQIENEQSEIEYIIEQANLGNSKAQFELAKLYFLGLSVDKDQEAAFVLFEMAAKNGNKKAYEMFAALQNEAENNLPNNFASLLKLALQGNVDAQFSIGARLDCGIDIDQDEQAATSWFEDAFDGYGKATDNVGDSVSRFKIANMFYWGIGVVQDKAEAAFWYQRSARLRHIGAMFALARMLEIGDGVDRDEAEAGRLVGVANGLLVDLGGSF
jgi:TPR repeat protein